MPAPEDLEKAARAIRVLVRSQESRTLLKPSQVDLMCPDAIAGAVMLEEGARKMRKNVRSAE